jgi:hypothetical protein
MCMLDLKEKKNGVTDDGGVREQAAHATRTE